MSTSKQNCPNNTQGLNNIYRFQLCLLSHRFGGFEFPPNIYFKIYTGTGQGSGVRYVSGKKMIKPASEVILLSFYTYRTVTSKDITITIRKANCFWFVL